MKLTLQPAYGRDYKSAKAAKEDWNANKDFIIATFAHPYSGKPTNKSQTPEGAWIRYDRDRKIVEV